MCSGLIELPFFGTPGDGEFEPAPPRADVVKSLKNGIVLNLVGMGAAVIRLQATVDQSEDILCWKDSDNPKHMISASVTEDGKYALIENCDPVNKVHVCDLHCLLFQMGSKAIEGRISKLANGMAEKRPPDVTVFFEWMDMMSKNLDLGVI
nr:prolyl endopeptidase-like [Ipomoea batatas]